MLRSLTIIFIGALFGAGLAIGGMLNPAKVAGFLDIFGVWDPSLAFVMGGGVVANFIGMRLVQRRRAPLFAGSFRLPDAAGIDRHLVGGAVLCGCKKNTAVGKMLRMIEFQSLKKMKNVAKSRHGKSSYLVSR